MTLYSTEDARKKIPNQYEMTVIAAARVREIGRAKNYNAPSIALKEIAEGKLDMEYYKNTLKGR